MLRDDWLRQGFTQGLEGFDDLGVKIKQADVVVYMDAGNAELPGKIGLVFRFAGFDTPAILNG